jgi:hypothetical protein
MSATREQLAAHKREAWKAVKAANRAARYLTRAVPVGVHVPRPRTVTGRCQDCPHGWKHHSEAGRCRRGCACTNGADR